MYAIQQFKVIQINLFVSVTVDDRSDLQINEGHVAFDVGSVPVLVPARNAYKKVAKWTSGLLPYTIERSQFTAAQITTITNSMRTIEQQTDNCIRCVERTNHLTWIRIYAGTGCWSYMGRQKASDSQDVSFENSDCLYQNIVIDELLHAVRFAHEQARPDRDTYVKINYENIQSSRKNNSDRYSTTKADTLQKVYDLTSIMHHKWNAFSKNGLPTISPKANVSQSTMGSASVMTDSDIEKVKSYYLCA
ncbi:unnamed protein product [Rotaria magnacalcarata]|uniref:Metalloendopeptidase n=1 Tax=Rotaria magnacalcarata TaxID=392030 RepID=A0A817A286_9BILA|nr:unnamed protein product [Rotaria magnacalcarata]